MQRRHVENLDYNIDSVIEDEMVTSVTYTSTRKDSDGMSITIEQACEKAVLIHTNDYLALTFVHANSITSKYSVLNALEHTILKYMLGCDHNSYNYIRMHKYVRLIEDIKS